MLEVIFSEGDFTLCREEGIGMNDTPWEGLIIKSDDLAKKHAVEVKLDQIGFPSFNGDPVKRRYNIEGTEVAHGTRMCKDSFADTEEYIEVLRDALAFAKRVNEWIVDNGWD